MKLLLVEDNLRLSERILYRLKALHTIDVVESGEDALEKIQHVTYGLILLDLGLPGMSGLEVCRHVRSLEVNTPILVLTGNASMADRIELLDAGADDYLTKPFNSQELRARISAVGRRGTRTHIRSIIHYRDIEMDIDKHTVSRLDTKIKLSRKEFDILEYLIHNKGRVMTREMIMAHVWSSHSNSWTSTIDVHIKHLRDKVDRPFEDQYITTSYGLGYTVAED